MPRLCLVGLTAIAFLVAGGGAGASPDADLSRWVATDLGNLGARVTVSDINDRGQIVGESANHGFVWENGSMRELGQGPFSGAERINERGQIIGTSSSASNSQQHAVMWENGKMIDLRGSRGVYTSVMAINERGEIIGSRSVPTGNGFTGTPVIWENGKMRNLWPGGVALAINNRGQVVGGTGAESSRAVVWQNGKITDLGPGVATDINERGQIGGERDGHVIVWRNGTSIDLGPGTAVAINGRDQVTGFSRTPAGEWHGFLWQNGTMTDLGTLGGKWSIPTAISNRGQVVGYSTGKSGVQHAFIWQNGTMTRLGSPNGNARTRAVAINEHNQIIGDNCFTDCGIRAPRFASKFAVLWTLQRG
ncbi:MAG: hypothetical protein ABI783_11580 [Actinomycetota bacterium]